MCSYTVCTARTGRPYTLPVSDLHMQWDNTGGSTSCMEDKLTGSYQYVVRVLVAISWNSQVNWSKTTCQTTPWSNSFTPTFPTHLIQKAQSCTFRTSRCTLIGQWWSRAVDVWVVWRCQLGMEVSLCHELDNCAMRGLRRFGSYRLIGRLPLDWSSGWW